MVSQCIWGLLMFQLSKKKYFRSASKATDQSKELSLYGHDLDISPSMTTCPVIDNLEQIVLLLDLLYKVTGED